MFLVRKPSAETMARLVRDQAGRELTYPQHGATRGAMPPGYRHDEWEAELGSLPADDFDRLADGLTHWLVQRQSGITIFPDEPASEGLTFALWFGLPAGYVTAVGRVVYVTNEPDRRGFAYGTLPEHPECGEEAFHLLRRGSQVAFNVRAFSRPAQPLARLGAPVTRALQRRMNQAYLSAMRAAART